MRAWWTSVARSSTFLLMTYSWLRVLRSVLETDIDLRMLSQAADTFGSFKDRGELDGSALD